MALRLAGDGHDVHVITSDFQSRSRFGWSSREIAGFMVHSIPIRYDNSMGIGARLWAFVAFALLAGPKAVRVGGDVVVATSTPLTISIPGNLVKSRLGIPLILEIRDSWPSVPIAMGALNNPLVRSAARSFEKWSYKRADRIIALSEEMRENVTKVSGYEEDVAVIPNGSDRRLFEVSEDVGTLFREDYEWLGNRPLVVYTGAFGRVNGVSYMAYLAAATRKIDPEIRFLAIGAGAQYEDVCSLASKLEVLDETMFIWPTMPKTKIACVLSAATVASSWVINIPVLHGNSANKLFDAFAAGRPVLVNYGGWQSDLLADTGAGIALDPIDYTNAAEDLVGFVRSAKRIQMARCESARLGREVFDRDLLYERFASVVSPPLAPMRSSQDLTVAI